MDMKELDRANELAAAIILVELNLERIAESRIAEKCVAMAMQGEGDTTASDARERSLHSVKGFVRVPGELIIGFFDQIEEFEKKNLARLRANFTRL